MATTSLPPPANHESNAQIGISIGLILALVVFGIFIARLMRRVRPPHVTAALLQRPHIYETRRREGIDRSMLDTIPVVKYHESLSWNGERQKKRIRQSTSRNNSARRGLPSELSPVPSILPRIGENEDGKTFSNGLTGLSPTSKMKALQDKQTQTSSYEPTSCSICTEDFQVMENVRVLPCKHIYHRRCIDPWLLDFAETCPLW
jgi:hypothetical protein